MDNKEWLWKWEIIHSNYDMLDKVLKFEKDFRNLAEEMERRGLDWQPLYVSEGDPVDSLREVLDLRKACSPTTICGGCGKEVEYWLLGRSGMGRIELCINCARNLQKTIEQFERSIPVSMIEMETNKEESKNG